MKKMDSYKVFKGKSVAGSASFSMRYNAEDEELEQLIEAPKEEPEETKDSLPEITEKKLKDSPVLSKVIKRSSSLDEPPGETWKFFTDIKGRITKTVEEKIEEIKSDRMKKKEKRKLITGGENSSVSDSEEKSEASTSRGESVSKEASIAASVSQATSCKESEDEEDDDEEQTEKDFSDSTPVRELRPPFSRPKSKKRASIEVAEEAFEEGDSNVPILNLWKENLTLPVERKPTMSFLHSDVIRTLIRRWHVFLPVVIGFIFVYIPCPKEILWACIGALTVLELRLLCGWLNWWPDVGFSVGNSDDDSCLFTGSFHVDSFHILPDQIRQLPSSDPETITHQGWLNEYQEEYSEESYRLRDTVSVWASLRGSLLTISTPHRPPSRRAFWSEPQHPRLFTHHRLYNLTNCQVSLLPDGLTNKRVWSKKYPIYIKLDSDSYVGSTYKDHQEKDQNKKGSDPPTPVFSSHLEADVASEALDEDRKSSTVGLSKKNRESPDLPDLSPNKQDLNMNVDKSKMQSNEDELEYSDFVHVSPTLVEKKLFLCLFARSDREKEIWFRRLVASIGYCNYSNTDDIPSLKISDSLTTLKGCREKLSKSYLDFMYNLAQAMPKPARRKRKRTKDGHSGSMWFNVFVSRIYYDFINNPVWMSKVQEKVQRKLQTVKLPGIVEQLVVSRLVVEGPGPVVDGWTEPKLDSSGVWADIDISYQGLTSITIDIHINLTGKKKDSLPPSPQKGVDEKKSAVFNSSVEDSGESSSDSDDRLDSSQPSSRRQSNSPSVVNRITHKYFNQGRGFVVKKMSLRKNRTRTNKIFKRNVAENKLVKKALEGVSSNTHISLIVEVKALVGTLVINIPPPPTNRLWYGFRPKPKLCMTARPVLNETVVNLVNITNWIEKKLYKEFEKVLVLPNMDDLVIPFMDRNVPF